MCECVACGGAHCAEEVESTICDGTMRELQACEQRHVSDDQPQRGFSHLQTAQPQALHILHLGTVITAYRHKDDIYHAPLLETCVLEAVYDTIFN